MKNIKKIIISFVISLIVVLIVQVIWNNFNKDSLSIYVALKDIYKGEKILKDDIKEIKVQNNSSLVKYSNIKIDNQFANENIVCGKVLESNDLTTKKADEQYEYLTIEVKDISDALAYQLKKGDYINVYYTTKNKELYNIANNKEEVVETDLNITFKMFENIKVIGLYDSSGIEVNEGSQYKAIMLRVEEKEAIIVSSIKSEGTFSVSILK